MDSKNYSVGGGACHPEFISASLVRMGGACHAEFSASLVRMGGLVTLNFRVYQHLRQQANGADAEKIRHDRLVISNETPGRKLTPRAFFYALFCQSRDGYCANRRRLTLGDGGFSVSVHAVKRDSERYRLPRIDMDCVEKPLVIVDSFA